MVLIRYYIVIDMYSITIYLGILTTKTSYSGIRVIKTFFTKSPI